MSGGSGEYRVVANLSQEAAAAAAAPPPRRAYQMSVTCCHSPLLSAVEADAISADVHLHISDTLTTLP